MQDEVLKEATICMADARKRLDRALLELQRLLDAGGEQLNETIPADVEEAKALLARKPRF